MSKIRFKAYLSTFQKQELAKYFLDLSKLVIGSMVVKFFEPSGAQITSQTILTIVVGLTIALLIVIIGLMISKGKKKNE